jgi:hypothetical protein
VRGSSDATIGVVAGVRRNGAVAEKNNGSGPRGQPPVASSHLLPSLLGVRVTANAGGTAEDGQGGHGLKSCDPATHLY